MVDAPFTNTEWKKDAKEEQVYDLSVHDEQVPSGPKFEHRHFLLLRVLWKPIKPAAFKPADFELEPWVKKAKEMLEEYHSWKVYYDSFSRIGIGKGIFSLRRNSNKKLRLYKTQTNQTRSLILLPPLFLTGLARKLRKELISERATTASTRRLPNQIGPSC